MDNTIQLYTGFGQHETYYLPNYSVDGWGNSNNYDDAIIWIDPNDKEYSISVEFSGLVGYLNSGKLTFNIEVIARRGKYINGVVYTKSGLTKDVIENNKYSFNIGNDILIYDNEYIIKVWFNYIQNGSTVIIDENESLFKDGVVGYNNAYGIILKDIEEPIVTYGIFSDSPVEPLKTISMITEKRTRSVVIDFEYSGNLLVTVDGITLSEEYDFTVTDKVIIFNDTLPKDTVINITAFNSGGTPSGLTTETYFVDMVKLPNETNTIEGVFKNHTINKFGVDLKKSISVESVPILILNGQRLLFGTDFYVDDIDKSILYLNGLLMDGDIVSVYYVSEFVTNEVIGGVLPLNISLSYPPRNESGFFEVQISKTKDFFEYASAKYPYQEGVGTYNITSEYDGKGVRYIRVVNTKTYSKINKEELVGTQESKISKIIFK